MIERLSTLGYSRQSISDIGSTRESLVDLQKDISSGKKAHSFDEMSGDGNLERVFYLQSAVLQNEAFGQTTTIIETRLTQMSDAVNSIQEIAGSLRNLLVTARNPVTADVLPVKQLSLDKLHLIADNLNSTIEGRYLFAGSLTNLKAVNIDDDVSNLNTDGTPNNNYYQGNSSQLSVEIQDGVFINYGITADQPAFQKIIAAAYRASEVGNGELKDQGQRDTILKDALDLLNEGLTDLQKVTASVNTNLGVVKEAKSQQLDNALFLKEMLSNETDTDIADASIQATSYQTVLQASFQIFARLSQLTLSQYL